MRKLFILMIGTALIFQTVLADYSWTFDGVNRNSGWTFQGVEKVEINADSLRVIGTQNPTLLSPPGDYDGAANGLFELKFRAAKTSPLARVVAIWNRSDVQFQQTPQRMIEYQATGDWQTLRLHLGADSSWGGRVTQLGVAFVGHGENFDIVSASLRPLDFGDWLRLGWDEFWQPDPIKPNTINFLSGPKFGGYFPNFWLLWIFAFLGVGLWLWETYAFARREETEFLTSEARAAARKKTLAIFFSVMFFFWVALDLRMTVNQIDWVRTSSAKSFRENRLYAYIHGNTEFYDFIDWARTKIGERARTKLISSDDYGLTDAQLYAYPLILREEKNPAYLLVFHDDKNRFDGSGTLVFNSGSVAVEKFAEFNPQALILKPINDANIRTVLRQSASRRRVNANYTNK